MAGSATEQARLNGPTAAQLISRFAAGLFGSYLFGWGFIALGTALGSRWMPLGEARTLVNLLVFLVLLTCFCVAFAARSLARAWTLLAGGGALMTLGGWLLSRGAP